MGSGFDNNTIRHHHHQFLRHKSIFLPILCKLSLKDIKLNRRRTPTFSDEPSSPKVSCIGQVKRNNRITGFPAAVTGGAASPATTHHHKYSKLRKLFSSKALLPPATTTAAVGAAAAPGGGRSKSCRSSKGVCVDNLRRLNLKKECEQESCVNIGEIDPPLPVVKRAAPPQGVGGDGANLWRRRFDGAALKKLQIQQIDLQINSNLKPPTV